MRFKFLAFLFVLGFISSPAQRAFKPIKIALKAKNYKEVINQVDQLRKDSIYRNNPKLYLFSIEANQGLNDAENMKLYLKQKYDTLAFFSTTHQIVREAVRLDSVERAIQQAEQIKPKQTNYICNLLQQYYPNVNAAARYFFKRSKYAEAMPYLLTGINLPHTEIGEQTKLSTKADTSNAALYTVCAYYSKQYTEVHRYEELALLDQSYRPVIFETLVFTAEAEKDTTSYRCLLEEAFEEYPSRYPFFIRLADYYTKRGDNETVLRLASAQIARDSSDVSALVAQCMANLNLQRYADCIASTTRLFQADSLCIEANYFMGASYVGQASALQLPDNALSRSYKKVKKEQNALFAQAEPFLEEYRQQAPQQSKRWAPLLYKVYLALNEGTKFEEIEKFLNP